MFYPKVRFRLNKELDKKTAINFLGLDVGGVNFANGILGVHPAIKKIIFNYIDDFYKKQTFLLSRQARNFQKQWNAKAGLFFEAANLIFKNYPWPRGRYIGYLSIFDCNPRFLHDKTFQIFYKHKLGPTYIVAHELLHFIFFDYLSKKIKTSKKKLTENDLWELSEIVNDVILDSQSFKKLLKLKKNIVSYPNLKNTASKLKIKFASNKSIDIDKLIDTVIYLK